VRIRKARAETGMKNVRALARRERRWGARERERSGWSMVRMS
jgi:hypothetical protein